MRDQFIVKIVCLMLAVLVGLQVYALLPLSQDDQTTEEPNPSGAPSRRFLYEDAC